MKHLADAAECYRNKDDHGLPVAMARAFVALLDIAELASFDLFDVIEKKMAYNATRSRMHGGKRL